MAPPTCATLPLGDPRGGCGAASEANPNANGVLNAAAADAEFARTRGLDSNRAFITGPAASSGPSGF